MQYLPRSAGDASSTTSPGSSLSSEFFFPSEAVREFASFNTPRGNKFNQEYEV
jgi:hypothetical protein